MSHQRRNKRGGHAGRNPTNAKVHATPEKPSTNQNDTNSNDNKTYPLVENPKQNYRDSDKEAAKGRRDQRRSLLMRRLGRWLRSVAPIISAFATVAITYSTYKYTQYAGYQWDTMRRNLGAFESVEGASPGVGKYQGTLSDGQIGIPIQNYGHVAAPKATFFVHVARGKSPPFYTNDYTFGGDRTEIPPGSGKYGLTVKLGLSPDEIAWIERGEETLMIGVTINYDNGFGKDTQVGFAFSYNAQHPDNWNSFPVRTFTDLQNTPAR